ncbi:Protein MMS22-like, partial [Armadillidium nasatum]
GPIKSETKMLRTLIKSSLNSNPLSPSYSNEEEHMRFYLRCCYSLLQLWKNEKEGRHSDWVVCLWDYFCKALDQPFILKANSLEGFATVSKTPSKVAEKVRNLVDGEMEYNETSWSTFLRILGNVLKCYDKEWRILNSRIYIKFHSRRMSELSNIGLHNTTLLFLTLAWSKDMAVCTKLCQLLSDVQDNSSKKLVAVVQSLTATAYLLNLKNCHLGELTKTIEKKILSIAHQCSLTTDLTERREFGHSIVVLCNGLQEVMEASSDLTLGHNNLYSSALSNFCSQASVIEQGSILSFVDAGLSKVMKATMHLHSLADGTGLDILETLWRNFQGYIKSQLLSLTPPSNLGSICASLVLCATRLQFFKNTKPNISEASCLFLYIIENEIISGRVALQFICCLLKEEFSNEYLAKICEKYDEKLVGSLLMNMIESGSSEDVMVASEAIFSTPKLKDSYKIQLNDKL